MYCLTSVVLTGHFDRTGLVNATGEQGRAPNPGITSGTAQVQLVNLTGGPITIALQGGGSETFQSGAGCI